MVFCSLVCFHGDIVVSNLSANFVAHIFITSKIAEITHYMKVISRARERAFSLIIKIYFNIKHL